MTNPTKTLFTKVCNSSLSVFESVVQGFEKGEGYKKGLHLRNPNVLYRVLSDFSSISIHNFRSFRSLCSCFSIILSQLRSIVKFSSFFRKCLNSSVSFIFSRYYGGVIKQYRFLQVFIGNMMVLQIFYMKIKHDIFPLYKPLIFCV